MNNRPIHFEMHSPDPAAAQQFFGEVFGWQFNKWDGPLEYWLITTGDGKHSGIDGGLLRSQDGQARTVNTLSVEDVDAFVAKVVAAGGTIAVPKMAIAGVGWLAYCIEPTGNLFGIMQDDPAAK
jgi:predicted enzyme related to lactoylglutathione lyase